MSEKSLATTSTESVNDNVNWLLIRASMIAKNRLIKASEQYDLSPMQALTICSLEPGQAVSMSSISEMFMCDRSNVTGIVERLVAGRYIERRESVTDRRVKTIMLTIAGTELRNKLLPQIAEHESPNLARLTEHEIAQLKSILRKALPES